MSIKHGKSRIFTAIRSNDLWNFSYVDVSKESGVATLTINRPEAMNALNETVVGQLNDALDEVNADESVPSVSLMVLERPLLPS